MIRLDCTVKLKVMTSGKAVMDTVGYMREQTWAIESYKSTMYLSA